MKQNIVFSLQVLPEKQSWILDTIAEVTGRLFLVFRLHALFHYTGRNSLMAILFYFFVINTAFSRPKCKKSLLHVQTLFFCFLQTLFNLSCKKEITKIISLAWTNCFIFYLQLNLTRYFQHSRGTRRAKETRHQTKGQITSQFINFYYYYHQKAIYYKHTINR